MHNKIIRLEPYFSTGELTVQPVVLWSGHKACYEPVSKYASVGSDYFKNVNPIPGHSIVYVLAMGAWETYGDNRNGDGFPEYPYKEHEKPPWITAEDSLVQHYKTFEEFGYNYRHHANTDPAKAVGKVMKAFWNQPMHRVELLVDLENAKAPDLAERIEAGEFPPVSMGTRIRYDVCNICGNRAPTRAQYCDHLRFQMRQIHETGQRICALNPSPKFFDISWVFKPADRTAFMLKKVAEETPYTLTGSDAGDYLDLMSSRKVAASKVADMDKIVQGLTVASKSDKDLDALSKMRPTIIIAVNNSPEFSSEHLRGLAQHPLDKVFSTLAAGGCQLTTPEIMKMSIYKSIPDLEVDDSHLDKAVALQNAVMELFGDLPQLIDSYSNTTMFDVHPDKVDSSILKDVAPLLEKRSGISDYLYRKFMPEAAERDRRYPLTQQLSLTNPHTGVRYLTTRDAALRAHDEIARVNLAKVLGGGLLLGGAYKFLSSGLMNTPASRKFRPLLAGTLGLLGVSQYPRMGPHYMTDQGVAIPTHTELTQEKTSGVAAPLMGTLALMTLMGQDYNSRLARGVPVGHPALPMSRRLLDKAESFVSEHPLLTAAGGTLLLNRAGKSPALNRVLTPALDKGKQAVNYSKQWLHDLVAGTRKMSEWVEDVVPPATDTVTLPTLDISRIATKIGELILTE